MTLSPEGPRQRFGPGSLGWLGDGASAGAPAGRRGVRAVGWVPSLLAASRARRRDRDPRAPGAVVGDHHGAPGLAAAAHPAVPRPVLAAPDVRAPGPRGIRDHVQLGDVHLRRQQRQGRGDLTGLLHQPAGHGADGRLHPGREAASPAVGRHGCRGGRRGRADARLRPAALGGAGAGVLVRHLRAGQEVGERRCGREPHPGDDAHRAVRGGVHRLAGGHRPLQLRLARRRPRPASEQHRHRHGDPADLLRRGRDPGVHGDAGTAAVPRADHPVRPRRPLLPRGHADRPLGRLHARVGGVGGVHLRGEQPPAAAAAAQRAGLGGSEASPAVKPATTSAWPPRRRRPRGRRGLGRPGGRRGEPWPRWRGRRRRPGPGPWPDGPGGGPAPRRAGCRRSRGRRAARAGGRRLESSRPAPSAPAAWGRPRGGRCRGSCRTRWSRPRRR